jgi:hypothetical protein
MKIINNSIFPLERALYGERDLTIADCVFAGEEDGESALKECKNIRAERCRFDLRYPLWHDTGVVLSDCEMNETCRAALWYTSDVKIENSKLHGTKALRECADIVINNSDIISQEFGWMSENIKITDSSATGEYFMLRAKNLDMNNLNFKGKYSFQYVENAVIENSVLDTKDAFWHAKNVHIKNSVVKGEYLAWYSDGLTLENCIISGTQPLCYCKNLKLINCEMHGCDLSFERSDVFASLTTKVVSIKNPWSGEITAPEVGEIIFDEQEAHGKVLVLEKQVK